MAILSASGWYASSRALFVASCVFPVGVVPLNVILVKDLSRFGRNYIEFGQYTDYLFPSIGCRFIALNNGIDTMRDDGSTDVMCFLNLFNEFYSRDTSKKVKAVKKACAESGKFMGTYPAYGYKRDPANKHHLVIDEETAPVVRRIFTLRCQGLGFRKIAVQLNEEGVQPPGVLYYQRKGKADPRNVNHQWAETTVKAILRNEVYLGNLLCNYTGSRSYKDGTMIIKPESEWIRHEATHEAIITPEEWEAVQEVNAAAKSRVQNSREPAKSLFSGKLMCADCKTPLVASTETHRRKNGAVKRYVSYYCGRYSNSGRSVCSWHRIYEQTLKQIVAAEIQAHAQAVTLDEAAVVDKLMRRAARYDEQRQADARQEVSKLRRRLQELENITAKLYENKVGGAISESTFTVLIQKSEQERLAKAERLDALLSEIHQTEQDAVSIQNWAAVIRKHLHLQELDRETIDELIDHIEIGERAVIDGQRIQEIKVFYRFVGLVGQ